MCLQKFFGDITRRKTVLLLSQVIGIPLAVVYLFQVGATACKRPILSLRTAAEASPFSKSQREKERFSPGLCFLTDDSWFDRLILRS